jgi:hypothetical protein
MLLMWREAMVLALADGRRAAIRQSAAAAVRLFLSWLLVMRKNLLWRKTKSLAQRIPFAARAIGSLSAISVVEQWSYHQLPTHIRA